MEADIVFFCEKTKRAKPFNFEPYLIYTSSSIFPKFQENFLSCFLKGPSQNTGTCTFTLRYIPVYNGKLSFLPFKADLKKSTLIAIFLKL